MDSPSQSLVRLNLETRGLHAQADRGWLDLNRNDVSRWDYLSQLVTIYGFEAPIEAAFAYTPNLKLVLDLRQRSRAGLAAQDLLELGLSVAEVSRLPQCFPMAPFGSPLEALGWMYVTERATLHHDAVRQHLLSRHPDLERACSYLWAYRGGVAARWSEFGHALDRVVRTTSMLDVVISSAHAAFRRLEDWTRSDSAARARGAGKLRATTAD